ncbi:Gfo/Idh/MocA family protein [Paenibacillus contaminans]|jgi:predicted dehydrogenase|uniref:Gfo/Idh/MocA family oxidoreductase n=1 Tax=Paenibacillus contaminans TaxID=450362 RepID=A0A329LXJ9_9BACL|nr:Gfo/Idh/MocA family oxidoreductase [Paenibacillus contaminans]RAV11223.1 gfo/Idh/MocA family oxidoreductase [Paenibacillus contaminans]
MSQKIRIGVIGAGSISESHLGAYAKNPEVELVAICDLNEERARAKAEKYNIPNVYTDYNKLLEDGSIDAVSVCTWNNSHAPISIAALNAGKNVLCEKPLCKTVEEAFEVEAAVKKSGKTLQVGFVRRYASNTRIVKEFMENGDLGEIYYAKASCIRRFGNPGGWFADTERSGGGPIIDIGVHVIDLCWYLMGRPKVKTISGNTYKKLGNRSHIQNLAQYRAADYTPDANNVEDMANALIRFENGASLLVDVSFTLHAKKDEITVKMYGDKGGVELEPELSFITEKYNTILNIDPQINNKGFDFIAGFQDEIDHFIDMCFGRKETLSPVEDGVEMMKILCGIYESAEKGTEISF